LSKYREDPNVLTSQAFQRYWDLSAKEQQPKFSKWQLPGGENYGELNFYWKNPPKGAEYRVPSGHAYEGEPPNRFAHVRFNDRVDAQGKKVLFIEEVQSDWHQAGREKGYKGEVEAKRKEFVDFLKSKGVEVGREPERRISGKILEDAGASPDLLNRWYDYMKSIKGEAVPSAPFSKTWHEMTMRRMVRQASEQGYDKIAWTTGEQQAARYDLSKQIKSISWGKNENGTFNLAATLLDDQPYHFGRELAPSKIGDFVGKEIASKIMSNPNKMGILEGVDLKVGGEGMKEQGTVEAYNAPMMQVGHKFIPANLTLVHSLDITPSMRESALKEGFPLFQLVPPVVAGAGLVGERLTRKKEEKRP